MSDKLDKDFFDEISTQPFDKFMKEYLLCSNDFAIMMLKAMKSIEQGEEPKKNHLFRMRLKTLELEKFGKQFRSRTLAMEKK